MTEGLRALERDPQQENAVQEAAQEIVNNGNGTEGNEEPQQPPPAQNTVGSIFKGLVMRALIVYCISSFFKRGTTTPASDGVNTSLNAQPSSNMWANGTIFDLYVYVSEDERGSVHFRKPGALLWKQEDLAYGDWTSGENADGIHYFRGNFVPSGNMLNNGTIYFHVYTVLSGKSPNPRAANFERKHVIHRVKQMNRYRKKVYRKTHNLLTGETEQSLEDQLKAEQATFEILSFWHPNITINIIDDHSSWTEGKIPKPLDDHIEFDEVSGMYYPVLYMNDYWNLNRDYYPINDTLSELPVFITFQPLSLFKWQIYLAQSMRNSMMATVMGGGTGGGGEDPVEDQDALKEALIETNPYLLGMTVVVSLLHSVFEFLAFKNDIQFWKERKTLEGLSVRSVFFNVFQSFVVLLYILDNDTNTVVKISVFAGMCIEIWKVKKVVNVRVDRESRSVFGLLPFKIHFEDKGTYVESSTKQYDEMAFKYLGIALFPLVVGYCGYSLMYHEHKGWYSFSVSMVYGFLLTFGFIMMTPQLFINYKLKSVAHLPWRMLSYKFLNTFIDDIFAFVIKMPMMYRIGCFRDDIVFLIYLYQRWIYRVDPKRVNEFGTSAEDNDGQGGVERAPQDAIEASPSSQRPKQD
ncbi:cleft lip and palate transmembrane protein 1 homolog [Galendromus occidentalis]|uniref:Cleft lip and palate transmembrane protein 1 homolog n=1 Tax=Galendromus occidentalis TaxID=34638 RepID=A0AAJ6QU29_9ACAR|nr:cleft lip and palate transmembrane protein 1 homolog [Galendromus occidentalis]